MSDGFYETGWPLRTTWRDRARSAAWFVIEGVVFVGTIAAICVVFVMAFAP